MSEKAVKKVIDWEAVELHYRAGIRSLKDIGNEFGCSDAGIIKKAKGQGWVRDLGAKIKAKAEAKVSAAAVSELVSEQKAANETQVVEANAQLQYNIRMEHRQDIGRTRKLFKVLLAEVEIQSEGLDLFHQLGELLDTSGMDSNDKYRVDKKNELYMKIISTPGRVDSTKKLTEILEKLVKMEREAFGIDSADQGESSIESVLKKVHDAKRNG